MSSSFSHDLPMKSIRVKPDTKFSSQRLSRELSMSDTTLEIYYRDGSVGIPFLWESQPGTPKVKFRESGPLPPLTPPPSLHSSPARKPAKKHPRSNFIHTVLPKLNVKKGQIQLSPTSSSSASSLSSSPWSSHYVPSSPFTPISRKQHRFSSPRMSVDSRIDEDDYESPASLCFGAGHRTNARSRGCSTSLIKLLLRDLS